MTGISFESVEFSYPDNGRTVLDGINLEIPEGQYLAVAGANGSGKTTLLRHLNGLLVPSSGTVSVAGYTTGTKKNLSAIRQILGMVFQFPEDQIVGATVYDDCAFGPENLGLPQEQIYRQAEEALRRVSLWGEREHPPHRLSAGQQQRLAIAGVLAMGTRYLAVDEGTIMLDPQGKQDFLAILRELHSAGHTIIAVTQDMEEFLEAEEGIVLSGGKIAARGRPADIIVSPDLPEWGLMPPPRMKLISAMNSRLNSAEMTAEASAGVTLSEYIDAFTAAAGNRIPENFPESGANTGGTAPVIQAENVSHRYLPGTELERTALSELSFTVPEGKCLAVLGSTGSGKTTVLHLLAGLIPLQDGSVTVKGIDLGRKKYDTVKLRESAGLLMQRPEDQLFEEYVTDDIAYGPSALGVTGKELKERVYSAMDTAGIPYQNFKDRRITTLSGGERRKTGVAGVLAMKPEILLMDEPTSGLDPVSRLNTVTLLETLKERGTTIVLVTHDVDILPGLADFLLILENGSAAFFGTAADGYRFLYRNRLRCPVRAEAALRLGEKGWPPLDSFPLEDEESFAAFAVSGGKDG
ncbi:MAG: ABC transporter ATP-binding protein [Spirochaetia bacterium]